MSLLKASFPQEELRYTWQDFCQFEKENIFLLSEKVLQILQKLAEDVGVPTGNHSSDNLSQLSPLRASNVGNGNGNRNGYLNGRNGKTKYQEGKGGSSGGNGGRKWTEEETSPIVFKTRKLEKTEGVEKIIQEIRVCLNKLTDKNYAKQSGEMKEKMQSLCNARETEEGVEGEGAVGAAEEDWKKVSKILFEIASTNKFYSKIYAQLYLELMQEFVIFQEILDTFLEGFVHKLETIQYIDPDVDYDGYCQYTKQQDERKAMTGFIVHLAINYVLVDGGKGRNLMEKVKNIAKHLTNRIAESIDKENCTNNVEEMSDILFLICSLGEKGVVEDWKKSGGVEWKEISSQMGVLSSQKVKEHVSLSSRALFKILDIQKMMI